MFLCNYKTLSTCLMPSFVTCQFILVLLEQLLNHVCIPYIQWMAIKRPCTQRMFCRIPPFYMDRNSRAGARACASCVNKQITNKRSKSRGVRKQPLQTGTLRRTPGKPDIVWVNDNSDAEGHSRSKAENWDSKTTG